MLKTNIPRPKLPRRHFWRHIKMSEMARIYIAMMIHNLSIAMTGLFGPLYIWQLTGSFATVCHMMVWYFVLRIFGLDFLVCKIMAQIGPKKTMSIGFLVTALSQVMSLSMELVHWPIWLLGSVLGMIHSFTVVPKNGEFSKIHNLKHEGKQIGYLQAVEKVGTIVGPLLAGAVAVLFGSKYIFLVGLAFMLVAIVPLLRSRETVPTKQKLNLRKLDFKKYRRNAVAYAFSGMELTMYNPLWPIFVAIVILGPATMYVGVGVLQSLSVVSSIVAAILIGRLVDKRFGRKLLRLGAVFGALFYLARMFIRSYTGALGLNIAHEVVSTANHIPISKGFYDDADSDNSTRFAYMAMVSYLDSWFKLAAWLAVLLVALAFGNLPAFYTGFAIAAAASLLSMTEKYRALD